MTNRFCISRYTKRYQRRLFRPAAWGLLALLTLAGLPMVAFGEVDICANPIVSDTTWAGGEVYVAQDCHLTVPADVTLTIQAGATIKLGGVAPSYASGEGSVAVIVEGNLRALGSASQPVVFTSARDDAYGGDSNNDGASAGAAGDWRGFMFRDGSDGQLENFQVQFGGSTVFTGGYGYGRAQIDVINADITLRHGQIRDGNSKGVYLDVAGLTPVLENLIIADNVDPNSNYYNRGDAIRQSTINMQPSYSALTFQGNDRDRVVIDNFREEITQDVTLGGAAFGANCGYTLCILTVPAGLTLTIEPGTIMDFESVHGITVASGGSLIAQGTQSQPISFTSTAAANQTGAPWQGLRMNADSQLRLSHCDVSYSANTNYGRGGLEIATGDAQVDNCRFHHNAGDGLVIYSQQNVEGVMLEDLMFDNNGRHGMEVYASRGTSVQFTLESATVEDNGGSGIYINNGGAGARVAPTLRNVSLIRNGSDTGQSSIRRQALTIDGYDNEVVLDSLTFTDNAENAIHWFCSSSLDARQLAAAGNGFDGIVTPGCPIYGGREWSLSDVGIALEVRGNVTVKSGAFLTLAPGTVLGFEANRYLYVENGGSLFALGTPDDPITFQGLVPTPGHWRGLDMFGDQASIFLRNCVISDANIGLKAGWAVSSVMAQNCVISANTRGVLGDIGSLVLRSNEIADNIDSGVTSGYGAVVDARMNYWGAPSGPYHPTLNPAGAGDTVGDNVLFDPWLTEPAAAGTAVGDVVVVTGSPSVVSPGQTADYSVQYLNLQATAVTNAVLVMQLPRAAEYVSSTHGGTYWPERDQVVWALGDVQPGQNDRHSVQVRFMWGLPRDYTDSTITLLSGDNYQSDEFTAADRAEYLARTDNPVSGRALISEAALYADTRFQAAFDQALLDGFVFTAAADVEREDTQMVRVAVLVDSARQAVRLLSGRDSDLYVFNITPTYLEAIGPSGGSQRVALDTGAQTAAGDWALVDTAAKAPTACTYEKCRSNCRWQMVGLAYVGKKVGKIAAWTAFSFLGGAGVPGVVWEVGSLATEYHACDVNCFADPQTHCCQAGQVKWTNSFINRLLTNCMKWQCNATTGNWKPDGTRTCVTGTRCVASVDGPGCVECDERTINVKNAAQLRLALAYCDYAACKATTAGKPRCRDLELLVGKDPNDITGPLGDLVPGQTVTYTIRFENEGEGRAYGVYIVNSLPEQFDAGSLVVNDGGQYLSGENQLVWLVGELGPKGDPDSEGSVSYTLSLKSGLASGTVIGNQAVVFFPSVPEETPTNTWVNRIEPLAAVPQAVITDYGVPVGITLEGRDVSSLPLDFSVVEGPQRGTLSGSASSLTYQPAAGATGTDSFSFSVSNGSSESRPAQVLIEVTSVGDTDPPQVLTVSPAADTSRVRYGAIPLLDDAMGEVFGPIIVLGVSEALDPASIAADSLQLLNGAVAMSATVSFDSILGQLTLIPREPILGGVNYTIALAPGVTDLAGNEMPPGQWSFETQSELVFGNGFED